MEKNFHRISQSLRTDNGLRSWVGILTGAVVLTLWTAWAFGARVNRYEISNNARLEVNGPISPVQADLNGKVVSSALVVGKVIHAGDALVVLDSQKEQLSLRQEQARLAALGPQIAVLQSQLVTESEGQADERAVLNWSEKEAQAKFEEADTQARLAEQEARRAEQLRASGIIAEQEVQRAEAAARRYRATADSLKISAGSLGPQLQVREADRDLKAKEVYAEIAKLRAEAQASAAAIRQLEFDKERRTIRASISGKLAECAELHPGQYISAGEKLGMVAPDGPVRMVAQFSPEAAFGKLHAGQPATVKLNGFPWVQYGTIPATVSQVAGEIRDGNVRVDLAVYPGPNSRIPLQHGAPGTVEVEVQRLSPVALVLRTAGRIVGAH